MLVAITAPSGLVGDWLCDVCTGDADGGGGRNYQAGLAMQKQRLYGKLVAAKMSRPLSKPAHSRGRRRRHHGNSDTQLAGPALWCHSHLVSVVASVVETASRVATPTPVLVGVDYNALSALPAIDFDAMVVQCAAGFDRPAKQDIELFTKAHADAVELVVCVCARRGAVGICGHE